MNRAAPSPLQLVVVAVISLVIVGLAFWPQSRDLRIAPAGLVSGNATIGPAVGGLSASFSASQPALNLAVAPGLYDQERSARLQAEIELATNYTSTRFGGGLAAATELAVIVEPSCSLHGAAYTAERRITLFTCPDLPLARVVNIAAHELIHQYAHDRYGDRHLQSDLILLEGLATWGAGEYWLSGAASFRAFAAPWAREGRLLPLATSYSGRSIAEMNQLYYQWAAFVEFLLARDGREAFDQLYLSGSQAPGSADYFGVYRRSLSELEAEWQVWLQTE